MKKPALIVTIALVLAVLVVAVVIVKKKSSQAPTVTVEEKIDLPVNTLPVEERPFISLTPDATGRNMEFAVSGAPETGEMEYEILYNTAGSQEGGLGSILLTATQPVTKSILLGTRSAGGATTYHEGVTGGSLTVTYGETRLKEQFNFLRFDPADPSVASSDLRFTALFPKTSFKKDAVVIVMKTFGLPAPLTGKLAAGPYAFFTTAPVKGNFEVSMKLPAGEFTNAAISTFVDGEWRSLKTTKKGVDTLVVTTNIGNVFVITSE